MSIPHLQSIFSVAHTDISSAPFNNYSRTLRLVVEVNLPITALEIVFANPFGEEPLPIGSVSIARCNKEGELAPDTLTPVTVGGVLSFALAKDNVITSDVVAFPLNPGDFFALNIYYPTDTRVRSGNWVSNNALRSRPGNFSADLKLPSPSLVSRFARTVVVNDMTVPITSIAQIVAHTTTPGRVVGCFGDSITQQGNWVVPFEKLLYRAYPGQTSLCNLGISGNRLLHDSGPGTSGIHGPKGIERFGRELLQLKGLTHAILEIGTNDIGQPGTSDAPEAEMITLAQYQSTMADLANQLHNKNVKVYVATLPPRPVNRQFPEERETLRHEMNNWIRSYEAFDAVLDFDKVLRRTDGKPGMQEGYALPDGLHPSVYGGMLIAKSIDLSLFGGDSV